MRRWTTVVLVGGVCAWRGGCEDVPQQVDAGQAAVPVAEIDPVAEFSDSDSEESPHPGAADFSTWPGTREDETFALMWLGGDEQVQLRAEPTDEAEVVASASWPDGGELEWLATRVRVDEPRAMQAQRAVELVASTYHREERRLATDQQHFELAAGDRVFFYQYDGEETCYYGVGDQIVLGDCLPEALAAVGEGQPAEGEPVTPVSKQWWVRVETPEGSRGWMLVDEAPVEVHRRALEGYDGIDGPDELEDSYVD